MILEKFHAGCYETHVYISVLDETKQQLPVVQCGPHLEPKPSGWYPDTRTLTNVFVETDIRTVHVCTEIQIFRRIRKIAKSD